MTNKNKLFVVMAIVVALMAVAVFSDGDIKTIPAPETQIQPVPSEKPISRVCLGKECYAVELATTPAEQELGLMFRQRLDKDKGMLFIFPQAGDYPFWMKNTQIPLDMVWLGPDKKIVFISAATPPCKNDPCPLFDPAQNASYVLEVNAGEMARIGAKVGDTLVIE
jgi:uncharacterized membrane protein (UPF0127 family)